MIAQFNAQRVTVLSFPAARIEMQPGERYAGLIIDEAGLPDHHLILLPGDGENLNWKDAQEWATVKGGELPNRREQALLYANLKSEFNETWYWSSENYSGIYAWCQSFGNGIQYYSLRDYKHNARAIRRVPV